MESFMVGFLDEMRKIAGLFGTDPSAVKKMRAFKHPKEGWVIEFHMADGSVKKIRNAHSLSAGAR
jgi:hypothetical protein